MTAEHLMAAIPADRGTLQHWISRGWLLPDTENVSQPFNEVDLARGRFIADLQGPMGINADGIDVILHLVDQLHGLRIALRSLVETRS